MDDEKVQGYLMALNKSMLSIMLLISMHTPLSDQGHEVQSAENRGHSHLRVIKLLGCVELVYVNNYLGGS